MKSKEKKWEPIVNLFRADGSLVAPGEEVILPKGHAVYKMIELNIKNKLEKGAY